MWEIEIGKDEKSSLPIKTDFRVKYCPIDNAEDLDVLDVNDDPLHIGKLQRLEKSSHLYRCNFDVVDYVVRSFSL